ncbi:MAG: peptidoglycan DD-metalloendopeptidase family protein [Muribaculaceae bacterium]|nr:peptidoglycan DD-metalloendopeptidase family protein [Muribaculaceae bacterium]
MLLSKTSKLTISLTMALAFAFPAMAQTYRLPGAHSSEHSELIAGQVNVGDQIRVEETEQFLEQLFEEELEPEGDIYEIGWDSESVNCYKGMEVPQTKVIDVSDFCMPHPGYVTSNYGYRKRFRRMHRGIDLKAFTGDTIRAAFDGKVRLTKYERRGYGYYVVMRHGNELETVYAHLSKFLVKPDQYVKAGDPIGLAGNTGRSFGSHLHFETRFMGYAINPAAIFDFANQTVHTDEYTFDKDTYEEARDYSPAAQQAYAEQYRQQYMNNRSANSGNDSGASSSKVYHKVRSGECLSKIAQRYGVSVRQICRLNGIKTTSKLKIGQRLRVK